MSARKIAAEAADQTIFDKAVPIADMFVAPYGRPISAVKVAGLRKRFNIQSVGVLYLSFRDDTSTYAVLDGNHRREAAKLEGFTALPARIYIDLTYEQEADLYVAFATVNKQTALDRFRARLEAREPRAVLVQDALRRVGMHVANTPGTYHAVNACEALDAITERHGIDFVRELAEVIYAGWGAAPKAWTSSALHGVEAFWLQYRDSASRARLADRMQHVDPESIALKASQIRSLLGLTSGSASSPYWRALLSVYNEGLRKYRLPDWSDRAYSEAAKAGFHETALKAAATRRQQRAAQP